MAIREGRWDCQYCGTTGNLGRDKSCPQCGRSRPEGTKFYLPKEATEVADETLVNQAGQGPDWVCAFCGTSNQSTAESCRSCGAAREGTSVEQEIKTYELDEVPTTGDMTIEERTPITPPQPKKKTNIRPLVIVGAAILAVACVAVIAFLVFGGRDVNAEVTGFEWERTIDIEAFQTVTEEGWEVPAGAKILGERQEVHHTEDVLDHVETREEVCGKIDLGDGFFQDKICTIEEPVYRQESVYQPYYTYEVDKWIVVRTVKEQGADHSPFWPRANLTGEEREGKRNEVYTVLFEGSDGENLRYAADFEEWQKFERSQQVVVKLNALGAVSEIER